MPARNAAGERRGVGPAGAQQGATSLGEELFAPPAATRECTNPTPSRTTPPRLLRSRRRHPPRPSIPRRRRSTPRRCKELAELGLPFLLAGTYAVSAYTGITRATKDLDVFCKAGDYPRILDHFQTLGYAIAIEDERWLGKVHKGEHFFDVIFASSNGTMPVNDAWFEGARPLEVFGTRCASSARRS